jgi:uncharacterized protein (DUF924 family)
LRATIDEILAYCFGPLDSEGLSAPQAHSLWFTASTTTDETCRTRFGHLLEQAAAGKLDEWATSNDGLMALVLLLDQMSRNVYRGDAAAFGGDSQALELAVQAINQGRHLTMPLIHRVFMYLPLEHSEDLDLQEKCVSLFDELVADTGLPQMAGFRRYAAAHRDVIAQFGRFPHRNSPLGRESTPEELLHMSTHKGF